MSLRAQTAGPSPNLESEHGSALVWALFFIVLITGMLIAHSTEMSANRRTMDTRYRRIDIAKNIAESGLTEATAYLRRQATQPVLNFAPQLSPETDPPRNETIDPSVGLVREFEVQGSLWGRYEIRKDRALDVSANYSEPAGTVWDLEARGILFDRIDEKARFDQKPNRVVSMQSVRTEMRGLPVQVPGNSTVVVMDPAMVTMLTGSEIKAEGKPAISYRRKTKLAVLEHQSHHEQKDMGQDDKDKDDGDEKDGDDDVAKHGDKVTGIPKAIAIEELSIAVEDVFRMRTEQVRNLSDVVLSNPKQIYGRSVKDIAVFSPQSLVLMSEGSALRGRMLLFVNGDFTAQNGNNSDFSGILYVTGNATIEGPFQFRGTMIVGGTLKVGGSSDMVALVNDQAAVTQLREALARYRTSKDLRPPAADGAYATPSELTNAGLLLR
ncbi:hypothetical protein LBMAG49_27040 [Planctomycetota bacterium]|nr:hypothetical protein LBMAG49_27040 [Planctomycetota bacterium]